MFVAPSQVAYVQERFPRITFQVVVTREAYRDILTIIVLKNDGYSDYSIEQLKHMFNIICSVKVDRIETVEGGLYEGGKSLVDKREWE